MGWIATPRQLSYIPTMRSWMSILRPVFMLWLGLQLSLSGLAGLAVAAGFEEARYFCARLVPSLEAQAQVQSLASLIDPDLLEGDDPAPTAPVEDCAACVMAQTALLVPQSVEGLAFTLRASQALPYQAFLIRADVRGPPTGSRAPPVTA